SARGVYRPMVSERDRAVVELIGRFRQMTAGQIGAALFADVSSKTPLDRCLKRLVEGRALGRLSRPVGAGGGGEEAHIAHRGRGGRVVGPAGGEPAHARGR